MNSYDDVKLIKLFVAGSSEAFESLLSRYRKQVYGYIRSMVKQPDIADDVFQETCIKVITTLKRGTYKESGKFIAWIMRVAHNQIMDYFRSQRNEKLLVADDYVWNLLSRSVEYNSRLDEHKVGDGEVSELRHLICMLSPDQREVLVMRYYMGMTHQAIADKLNIGISTALRRVSYAVVNLRKMVEKNKKSTIYASMLAS